jgi:HSP20 family protein
METLPQRIPVRVYQSEQLVMITAPMPGLEPGDISVTVSGNRVAIRGEERGPGQHNLDLLEQEWTIGPYYREIALPVRVNGRLSNATYGNGVLVLSLPKLQPGEEEADVNFELTPVSATHGERVGHVGKEIHPTTRREHEKRHR